jgi:hypothetical protein
MDKSRQHDERAREVSRGVILGSVIEMRKIANRVNKDSSSSRHARAVRIDQIWGERRDYRGRVPVAVSLDRIGDEGLRGKVNITIKNIHLNFDLK